MSIEASWSLNQGGTRRHCGEGRAMVAARALALALALGAWVAGGGAQAIDVAAGAPPTDYLGGFDLRADCAWYFDDPNADAIAQPSDPYSWSCVVHHTLTPIDQQLFNVFAAHEYGDGAYAVLVGSEPTDWAAYRDAQRLGGFDLRDDCAWYFDDPNADAVAQSGDPHSWTCVVNHALNPVDDKLLDVFAVHEYGAGAHAVLEGPEPTDWAAYR